MKSTLIGLAVCAALSAVLGYAMLTNYRQTNCVYLDARVGVINPGWYSVHDPMSCVALLTLGMSAYAMLEQTHCSAVLSDRQARPDPAGKSIYPESGFACRSIQEAYVLQR
jgi:hypothetical protein